MYYVCVLMKLLVKEVVTNVSNDFGFILLTSDSLSEFPLPICCLGYLLHNCPLFFPVSFACFGRLFPVSKLG